MTCITERVRLGDAGEAVDVCKRLACSAVLDRESDGDCVNLGLCRAVEAQCDEFAFWAVDDDSDSLAILDSSGDRGVAVDVNFGAGPRCEGGAAHSNGCVCRVASDVEAWQP